MCDYERRYRAMGTAHVFIDGEIAVRFFFLSFLVPQNYKIKFFVTQSASSARRERGARYPLRGVILGDDVDSGGAPLRLEAVGRKTILRHPSIVARDAEGVATKEKAAAGVGKRRVGKRDPESWKFTANFATHRGKKRRDTCVGRGRTSVCACRRNTRAHILRMPETRNSFFGNLPVQRRNIVV